MNSVDTDDWGQPDLAGGCPFPSCVLLCPGMFFTSIQCCCGHGGFWKWPRSPTLLSTEFPYLYWFVPLISLPLDDKLLCGRDRGSDTALHSGAAADPWLHPGITQHQTVCTHYLIWCRQSLSWALAFPPVLLKVSLRLRRIRWLSHISSHHRGKNGHLTVFYFAFALCVCVCPCDFHPSSQPRAQLV